MSVSRIPVAIPRRALARAMLVAIVLLPTPPLALLTAMTLVTLAIGRFWGRPRFMRAARLGGVPDRGRPWVVLDVCRFGNLIGSGMDLNGYHFKFGNMF